MPRNPITADERDFIHECLSVDRAVSFAVVARELDRHRSTISREVARNGGRHAYRPSTAGDAATARRRRPKSSILSIEGTLRDVVIELLGEGFSPVATAALCAREDGPGTVCAETIYQARPQGHRVPPVPPTQTQEATGRRIVSSVSAGAECGADQRATC